MNIYGKFLSFAQNHTHDGQRIIIIIIVIVIVIIIIIIIINECRSLTGLGE